MSTTGSTVESGGKYCEQNNSDYWVWATEGGERKNFVII
jgi:hypothetical protein